MPPKPKKGYDLVQQGVKVLYAADKPEVDVVAVPGLGANPEESWKSGKNGFSWLSDKEGLQRDFPKARVLLYLYESAWSGPLKVKQFLSNLATTLLHGLRSEREDCPRRPLVFIGHSMGGLVVAKAVVTAESRKDSFPLMFEAITGCVFFGSPFNGTPAASAAAMLAQMAEKVDQATSSKLLDLMKPGDEGLNDLKNDFVRLAGKLSPKIELFCFYEEQPTDFAQLAGLPSLFGLWKVAIPKNIQEFVSRDSATLTGVDRMGLACIHRDLVKFDGFKDGRYQLVRDPLKKIIHSAQLVAKNRLNSTRDIDRALVKSVLDVLDGAPVQMKLRALARTNTPSSWITKEAEFTTWLGKDNRSDSQRQDCLWIRGPEGRGKTVSAMAAVDEIDSIIKVDEDGDSYQAASVLSYFFCDPSTDYNSAEELLKSLLRQLVDQQDGFATYAKQFAKKKGNKDPLHSQSRAQLSIENLWQSLQDMLTDEYIGVGTVYFIVNNLHALPEDADSTAKFLSYLHSSLQELYSDGKKRIRIRWLFTSRENHSIGQALSVHDLRLIDLGDPRYGNQVQLELRKHAQQKIAVLGSEKKYNKALAYYASSLIGKRAQNTQWIDITCVQLAELPPEENDLRVRRVLEGVPQDLKALLDRAWLSVFNTSGDAVERIKDILRALVLTFEEPTEAELALLAGLPNDEHQKAALRDSVEKCKPLLTLKRTAKGDNKVSFMNVVVKTHLQENSRLLLSLPEEETRWEHGMLALRCFSHLVERFDVTSQANEEEGDGQTAVNAQEGTQDEAPHSAEAAAESNVPEDAVAGGASGPAAVGDETANVTNEPDADGQDGFDKGSVEGGDDDGEDEDEDNDGDGGEDDEEDEDEDGYDDEEEEEDDYDDYWSEGTPDESPEFEDWPDLEAGKALEYAVKHWLHHASKATREIAEDLSLEVDFWKPESPIRTTWLADFHRLTNTFNALDITTLTGLHVAASIGFAHLVSDLLTNGHSEEINKRDGLFNTPLHLAAWFGRPNIAEELLNRGATIDDGIEGGHMTPLQMAAFSGQVAIMKKLLRRDANANAVSKDTGPVVSAAIRSGNQEAVRILVESGVSLALDRDDIIAPLAMSALLSDLSMFDYLIEACADKLPPREYDKAFVQAATVGRLDILERLLQYQYPKSVFQEAAERAANEGEWDIVPVLLKHCEELDCEQLFYSAATGGSEHDRVLDAIWEHTNGSIFQQTLDKSLYEAADSEKESTVKVLLEKFGADPNAPGDEYGNALTAAAYDGTMEIVQLLLHADAEVNSTNGWAIQAAAGQGHIDVVKLLLDSGADVNAYKASEYFTQGTALQAACEAGYVEVVKMLIEHKANPDLGAGEETCPLVAAARKGEAEILECLVKAGAKIDVFGGPDMSTPLINAAVTLPQPSLQLLLDAGADINLPDHDGDTAVIAASARGDKICLEFLLERGADIMHTNHEGVSALQLAYFNGRSECASVLINWLTYMMKVLKQDADSGNVPLAQAIRAAALETKQQAASHDTESKAGDEPATNGLPVDVQVSVIEQLEQTPVQPAPAVYSIDSSAAHPDQETHSAAQYLPSPPESAPAQNHQPLPNPHHPPYHQQATQEQHSYPPENPQAQQSHPTLENKNMFQYSQYDHYNELKTPSSETPISQQPVMPSYLSNPANYAIPRRPLAQEQRYPSPTPSYHDAPSEPFQEENRYNQHQPVTLYDGDGYGEPTAYQAPPPPQNYGSTQQWQGQGYGQNWQGGGPQQQQPPPQQSPPQQPQQPGYYGQYGSQWHGR